MERFACNLPLDGDLPCCAAAIREIHDYWRRIRPAGAGIPGRQHFDPADIPRLLPSIRLYDVQREPRRFRYRLMGTELVRVTGRDTTGLWFDECVPRATETPIFRDLLHVSEGRGICYRRGFPIHLSPTKDHLTAERILLPLARNGRDVDMILALTLHHPAVALQPLRQRQLG